MRSNHRGDLRAALAESCKQLQQSQTGPRVVQHTTKSNKVIDTEKTLERKEFKPDGLIVTERKRTVEHEEVNNFSLLIAHRRLNSRPINRSTTTRCRMREGGRATGTATSRRREGRRARRGSQNRGTRTWSIISRVAKGSPVKCATSRRRPRENE